MGNASPPSAVKKDDLMYAPFGNLRWRLFFESDFMEAILSGASDLLHSSLCDHLSLPNNTYDLSKTKLMFFPALLQCRWVCFVWSVENNVISVFEPSYGVPVPDSRVEAIERSCFLLKLVMHTLSRSVFHGLSHEAMSADMRLLTLSDIYASFCFNRSGALCSFFCRCYDGGDLTSRPSELDADAIAAKLLNEIVDLKDNSRTIQPQLKTDSIAASSAS